MTNNNRKDLEDVLAKLNAAALNAEPGSEEMSNIIAQVGMVTDKITALDKEESDSNLKDKELDIKSREVSVKELNSHPKFDKVMKAAEIIGVPVGVVILDRAFTTAWTKMVCRWEKDETFRSSAGRAVGNLFKFKK